jgi:L-alanine-DL-glutamate epimerase-like enolase superfamily enzyme
MNESAESAMRITRVDIFSASLPLKVPFRIAIGVTIDSKSLFIRVHTDAGLYGLGEANVLTPVVGETPVTALASATFLAKLLIGADPLDVEGLVDKMRRAMPTQSTTRSAFDMALWDIVGKAADMPLYAVLGGRRRTIVTDNTVGLEAPEIMAERASDFVARGFTAIKVKLGTDLATDIERVRLVRAAVGPAIAIRVDANQGWSRVTARQALTAIAPFGPQYCEQPVAAWDIEGLADIRRTSPIPIMADEALFDERDAVALIRRQAADYFNIKLAKSGGISVALRINAIAEADGIACMVGCMTECRLGLSAALHFASARSNVAFADLDGGDMLKDDPVTGGFAYGPGGEMQPTDAPGLGVDLDAGFVATLPVVTID